MLMATDLFIKISANAIKNLMNGLLGIIFCTKTSSDIRIKRSRSIYYIVHKRNLLDHVFVRYENDLEFDSVCSR